MKKNYLIFSILLVLTFFYGCGEGKVDLTEAVYEPKIVIDGYIYPHHKVEDIRITRNFPLNQNIDVTKIILYNALVKITDMQSGDQYQLTFNPFKLSFEYNGNDLVIDYGKSYKINVSATIDGKNLSASSVTTVPLAGLRADQHSLDSMSYREKDAFGNLKKFLVSFSPSLNCKFHVFSLTALDASLSSFIYNNAYLTGLDSNDVKEDFDRYRFSFYWRQNSMPGVSKIIYEIEWLSIWFYGNYRLVIFAGDKNFQDFTMTHKNVMELDGNFHEPKMHIEGDGIGVFASALADTVYFKVIK